MSIKFSTNDTLSTSLPIESPNKITNQRGTSVLDLCTYLSKKKISSPDEKCDKGYLGGSESLKGRNIFSLKNE